MTKTLLYCVVYAALNVSGASLIKLKIKNTELTTLNQWIAFLFTFNVVLAFACIFLSALVLFKALSTDSLSTTIPMATGINFILTVCAGYFIFKDNITIYTIFGFILIIAGIFFISFNQINHAK